MISRGGNRLSLGDQESVGRNAKGGVMVEAAPSPSFKMSQPDLLLEFLIVAFDPPAQLGNVDELTECDVFRSVDSQYLIGSFSPSGHSSTHSFGRLSASQ